MVQHRDGFLSAKEALDHGNPELMKVWVNTKLGETWEERGETADDMALLSRREMYPCHRSGASAGAHLRYRRAG